MTSPQLGLLPARSDDRLAVLTAAQLVARGGLEFGQRLRAEVRQGVALEPGPLELELQLQVSEFEKGTYRVEVSLTWKTGRAVLMAARGAQRTFRSLDTLAKFLRSMGIGAIVVRMELKP
jgi:hypothetical protein